MFLSNKLFLSGFVLFALIIFSLIILVEASTAMWSSTYGGIDNDLSYALVENSDGGYALAGTTYSFGADANDFCLVKTDASGNLQWNKTYGGTEGEWAYALVENSDGGYALAGFTYSLGAGEGDFWLIKTDASGNLQWNKTYGGTEVDAASSLVETSDGGYALAGITGSFSFGANDFWLVKTDEHGFIPEFPSWIILPLFLIATIVVTVYKMKLTKSSRIH